MGNDSINSRRIYIHHMFCFWIFLCKAVEEAVVNSLLKAVITSVTAEGLKITKRYIMGTMVRICVLKRIAGRWTYGNRPITKHAKWLSSVSSPSNLNPSGIVAYDSQSKLLSPIFTSQPGIINWYVCGPTVYDSSHIGHAWYVSENIIIINLI